ncbi:MAG: hypothetical protein D6767_08795 [Candidatus Hydrogenedentota bacterium]|nr:MAG: hypothetical protein D6767_08795 [Candidatus Hydrogenedentota bacterium]
MTNQNQNKIEKAAKMIAALGIDYAAAVLKHLNPEETEKIMQALAKMPPLTPEEKREILQEFDEKIREIKETVQAGPEVAKQFLEKALGEKAKPFIEKIEASEWEKEFTKLTEYKPETVASLLTDIMPQAAAAVLSKLPPAYAAKVLKELPDEFRVEVVKRISRGGKIAPEALKALLNTLQEKLEKLESDEPSEEIAGEEKLAEILAHMNTTAEENILSALKEEEPEMVDRIKEKLYQFEDLIRLNNRELRLLFETLPDNKLWATALKGAGIDLRRHILGAVSAGRSADIMEEMEFLGPLPLNEIEAARREIMKVVERLDKKGEIILHKEKEEYVE